MKVRALGDSRRLCQIRSFLGSKSWCLCFAAERVDASSTARAFTALERASRNMLRRVAAHAEEGRGASRGASPSDAAFFDSADDMDLLSLLANSPTAKALGMGFDPKSVSSGSMMRQFVDQLARLDGTDSPSPVPSGAPPRSPSPKLPSKLTKLPQGAVRPTPGRSMFRSASPSPTAGRSMIGSASPSPTTGRMLGSTSPSPTHGHKAAAYKTPPTALTHENLSTRRAQFLDACAQLEAFRDRFAQGACIIGNGRSVLGVGAGPLIDRFATVVRFNDYVTIAEPVGQNAPRPDYRSDVGEKVDLWVVSDWTCVKLINKYPERTTPVLIAIPYYFMGKPYYKKRRAELEQDLTEEQLARCTFIPIEVVKNLVEANHFGDRWPSSGLITIAFFVSQGMRPVLHGFDFFKAIDGKIHYMEDTHTANHHADEEERICRELVRAGSVSFLV